MTVGVAPPTSTGQTERYVLIVDVPTRDTHDASHLLRKISTEIRDVHGVEVQRIVTAGRYRHEVLRQTITTLADLLEMFTLVGIDNLRQWAAERWGDQEV